MISQHPFIVDHPHEAEALGIPKDLAERRILGTITFPSGRYGARYVVPINCEYSWQADPADSETVATAKSFARDAETRFSDYISSAATQAAKINKDQRFSTSGKEDALIELFEKFSARALSAITPLSSHFTGLYAELLNAQVPPELRPSDAVSAIADMEYRRVLLSKDQGERYAMLMRLAASSAYSPLLRAALRTGPEVVDLTEKQMRDIKAAYAVSANAQTVGPVWCAASGLAFVHSVIDQGFSALAAVAGKHATLPAIPAATILANEVRNIIEKRAAQ